MVKDHECPYDKEGLTWAGDPCGIALSQVGRQVNDLIEKLNADVLAVLEKYKVHSSIRRQIEHLGEVAQKKVEKL